ncbi:MAG: EFR1 family ferrodoxin [Proteocatella sp.]
MRVNTLYFSATGTTKKVVQHIAEQISLNLNKEISVNHYDFTLPEFRQNPPVYSSEDIVVIGVPVYAGRVPNVLLNFLSQLNGHGALAVGIVLYGNRNYDDALIELQNIVSEKSFTLIGAGAFIGEHSFSKILAKDSPNPSDMLIAQFFAKSISSKILEGNIKHSVNVRGNSPLRPYYRPKDPNGNPVDIRKVVPKTNERCNNCKICVSVCPMGSIKEADVTIVSGVCIKCGACIKKCPQDAKYYDDIGYLRHKTELEVDFAQRKDPEIFI